MPPPIQDPSSDAATITRERIGNARISAIGASFVREIAVAARCDLLRQDEIPKSVHVLLHGQAIRYRTFADGRRQITAVVIPGDICDLQSVMAGRALNGVAALDKCRFGEIAVSSFADFDALKPELKLGMWKQILRDDAIAREWLSCLGRLKGLERLAHLFCEMWTRLRGVGFADKDACELRLTQADLGDILGLSSVHVNRTLHALRATGLIEFESSTLRIFDHRELAKLAKFNPSYLQTSAI